VRKQFKFSNIAKEILSEDSLDTALIMRAIEGLKASGNEVSPTTIALALNIPRSFLYANFEFLDLIYRNMSQLEGHDKLIMQLLDEIANQKKQNHLLTKKIDEQKKEIEKGFNDGFAKGASLNFKPAEKSNIFETTIAQDEIWARGVLQLDLVGELSEQQIKKNYRLLASMLHPDSSGKDSAEQMHKINQALEILTK